MTAKKLIKAASEGHYLRSSVSQEEFFMEQDDEHLVYVVISHPLVGDLDFTIDTTNWKIADD